MLVDAVDDLLTAAVPETAHTIAVFVGWPDPERPGAPPRPSTALLATVLGLRLGLNLSTEQIRCVTGETAGARVLVLAAQRLQEDQELDACLVVAADSWLTLDAVKWLTRRCPLRSRVGDDGMAPAEAAAAVWMVRSPSANGARLCGGGISTTDAPGLGHAVKYAMKQAERSIHDIGVLVFDSGTNTLGTIGCALQMSHASIRPWVGSEWIPARSIGHVGAAAGIINVLLARHLLTRHGEGGTALCVTSGRGCEHVALAVSAPPRPTASVEEKIIWAV